MLKGILFDFDGVLAVTMEDNYRAWTAVFKNLSYTVKADEYYLLEGMRMLDIAKKFCRAGGINEELAGDIVVKKDEYYARNHAFQFYPGVENSIANLKKAGIPMGIVTASGKNRLTTTVSPEFLGNFSSVITSETGGKGKPFPDPYRSGASELNLNPAECIVVENAPLGIQSAKSAGAYCVAITSTLPKKHLSGADKIIDAFTELERLEQIINLKKRNG